MSNLKTSSWRKETSIVFTLALPIIANGMLESGGSFFNVFLVAHLGPAQLAANALVSYLFFTLMVIFWGLISAVSILIAHHHGANNDEGIAGSLRAGVYLSLILSVPIMLLLWFAPWFFAWTGQPPTLIHEARQYLHALTWAVPVDLLGFTLMQLFPGISKPRITFYFTLMYLPLMLGMNYLFMFGKWGLPALGLAGIGYGTTVAYALVFILIAVFIWQRPAYRRFWQISVPNIWPYLRELLYVGVPLGFTYCLEIGYFFVFALCMGKMGNIILAAHQIVMQYFWIATIVIYSFGQALTIRVGWHIGAKSPHTLKSLFFIGQTTAIVYGSLIACVYWLAPHYLIAFDLGYFPHPANPLAKQIMHFFHWVAIFQLLDALRTICLSLLRGIKDTRFTLIMAGVTFWLLALPLGYLLGFVLYPHYPIGLWLGAIIGNIVALIVMGARLYFQYKKL